MKVQFQSTEVDRFVVGDAIPKSMHSAHTAEESIIASSWQVRKGTPERVWPDRRLVPTGQQVSPKAEVEFGHQIVGGRFLSHSFETCACLGDVMNLGCFQEAMEIAIPIGAVTPADRPLGHRCVNRVAKDDFHIREYFEESSGDCGVPLVQPDGSLEVTPA
jgi:hypothetical protein